VAVIVRCLGRPRDGSGPAGEYLARYDPEAFAGGGDAEFTTDPSRALRFAGMREALECTRAVPRACPMRADGKPNRPLTMFTLQYVHVAEDA